MKIIAKTLLASSLCVLMVVPAHAGRSHDDGPLLNRVERQHQRIVGGVKSGALTRKETRKLKKQNHKTRRMARKFNSDDVLSVKERRILDNRLDKVSHRIYKFKHNDRERNTDWVAFRDTNRDSNRHHGHNSHQRHNQHHQHGKHHDGDHGRASCRSDHQSWPHYGFLSW
jgi:hypothetical protein